MAKKYQTKKIEPPLVPACFKKERKLVLFVLLVSDEKNSLQLGSLMGVFFFHVQHLEYFLHFFYNPKRFLTILLLLEEHPL
jgi:hypothetical protein